MIRLNVNGSLYEVDVDENMPLLWVLRDELELVGTKYGCGKGLCGACSVLVNGNAVRSCLVSVGSVGGQVTTIEGVGNVDALHAVQEAWIEHQVAQCGYCQPGMIISTIALLARNPTPTDEDIESGLAANLCRCGGYSRILSALKSAAAKLSRSNPERSDFV